MMIEPYTDDDHERMDEQVPRRLAVHAVKFWHENPWPVELIAVLRAVMDGDERLDRKHLEITDTLFEKHPSLGSKLEEAWKTGSYREIRNLDYLQAPGSVSSPISATHLKALQKGLSASYQGCAVDGFHQYLKQNDKAFHAPKGHKYYAKFCSIVQSSGTGKTRLMLELATKGICVLYMNIRSREDKHGYPQRDCVPANILTHPCESEREYCIRCFAFFGAVFKVLQMFLEKELNWYEDMCTIGSPTRASFFVALEKVYANVKEKISTPSAGSIVMKKCYQEMVTGRGFQGLKGKPKVVIAFDEAHVLHEAFGPRAFLPATALLLQVIKEYSEGSRHSVWAVFSSTTSKVTHFASSQALLPSARVAVEGQLVFSPFTQLGWDQLAPPLEEVQPGEVAKGGHILRYGRPLWVSLKDGFSLQELLQLAKEKLCGTEVFEPHDHHQVFAVLAQRFGLDIAFGHRDAIGYVERSVASHLRVCLKTTENRIWSYSTYPSEPILSCAAALWLHQNDNLDQIMQVLALMVNDALVDISHIGELVGRFLWLLAKDLFVRTQPEVGDPEAVCDVNSSYDQELQDCQLVPVVEYFEFVFGPKMWEAVPQAKEEFQNAYINFSHWVSMDFNIRRWEEGVQQLPIEEWTLCHWERTSAVQCCHNQPLVDKVIPIYFKPQKDNDPVGGMSHILISDKARNSTQSSSESLSTIERDHWSIAPGYRGLPYIAILVDFGVERSAFDAMVDSSKKDTCLRIYASGLDTTIYPFLDGRDGVSRVLKDLYKRQSRPPFTSDVLQDLEDQMRFGRSNERRYMNSRKRPRWS